ncbi:MAG: MBL fold metallo-hydrolase [Planctomycetota bacterium]
MDTPRLNRRQFAALAAAGAVALPAHARAEPKTKRAGSAASNAGAYHTRVGGARVSMLTDGHFTFDPIYGSLGANVPRELFEAAVRAAHLDGYAPVNALLVQTGGRVALIDAGSGETFAPTTGRLIARLAEVGVMPADVTDILVTHAHLDHVGGLMVPGAPTESAFPNAAVHIAGVEAEFWRGGPALEASGMPDAMKPAIVKIANDALAAVRGQLRVFDGSREVEVLPGITAVPAPGHTPGHTAFQIADGDETLLFVGDAIFFPPVMTANPDWHIGFDTDPVAAAVTRTRLMDRIAADRIRIAGTHLPFPGFARLTARGSGFDYHPEAWRFDTEAVGG